MRRASPSARDLAAAEEATRSLTAEALQLKKEMRALKQNVQICGSIFAACGIAEGEQTAAWSDSARRNKYVGRPEEIN